ncbi:hypothetical protein CC2G_000212 [Coprinopsis cinerea AmutBmut pab1-1]|nr:hypothetical protein CC2G_000212 [Coprinopsis cinerea AmutBmut pab1-1]
MGQGYSIVAVLFAAQVLLTAREDSMIRLERDRRPSMPGAYDSGLTITVQSTSHSNTLPSDERKGARGKSQQYPRGYKSRSYSPPAHRQLVPGPHVSQLILVAQDARQHIISNHATLSQLAEGMFGGKDTFRMLAGFHEPLIERGIGYLQQVHIFSSTSVAPGRLALEALGKATAPYSAAIFTPTAFIDVPVFDTSGKPVTFDDHTLSATGMHLDDIIATRLPVEPGRVSTSTAHELEEIPGDNLWPNTQDDRPTFPPNSASRGSDGMEGGGYFEQVDDGGGLNGNPHEPKVAPEEGSDDDDEYIDKSAPVQENAGPLDGATGTDEQPPSPPRGVGETGGSRIHIHVEAELYRLSRALSKQSYSSKASIPAQKCQVLQLLADFEFHSSSHSRTRECHFRFSRLKCGSKSGSTAIQPYHQRLLKVDVDTMVEHVRMYNVAPATTLSRDACYTQSHGSKSGQQAALKLAMKYPLGFSAAVEGTKINETSGVVEQRLYRSAIRQEEDFGRIWWTYEVDDENHRVYGIEVARKNLPRASIELFRRDGSPSKPTKQPHFEITLSSCWTLIQQKPSTALWKIWSQTDDVELQYSNIGQWIKVEIPTDISEDSHFLAKMEVKNRQTVTVYSKKGLSTFTPVVTPLGEGGSF